MTVVVLNLHFRDSEQEVPNWMRVVCFKYLARILCIKGRKPATFARIEQRMEQDAEEENHPDLRSGLRKLNEMYLFSPVVNGHGGNDVKRTKRRSFSMRSHRRKTDFDGYDNYQCERKESEANLTLLENGLMDGMGNGVTLPRQRARQGRWNTYEWREVAHIVDRLFFVIVFVLMTASTMIIVSVPLYRKPFSSAIFDSDVNS